jgi:hypothetical protein
MPRIDTEMTRSLAANAAMQLEDFTPATGDGPNEEAMIAADNLLAAAFHMAAHLMANPTEHNMVAVDEVFRQLEAGVPEDLDLIEDEENVR